MHYKAFSQYRSELMGAAMLWVMLFHAYDLDLGLPLLNWGRAAGFGGVDIFILLSSMGLTMSLIRREQEYGAFLLRRSRRILPAYFVVMVPYTLFLILAQGAPWSALFWNSTLLYYWVHCPGAFNWYNLRRHALLHPHPSGGALAAEAAPAGAAAPDERGGYAGRLGPVPAVAREGYYYTLDIFYRIPLFILGIVFGVFIMEDRKLGWKDLLFWGLWTVLGGLYLYAVLHFTGDSYPILFPLVHLFLFSTVPMCLVLCFLFQHLPLGWLRRFLRLVGRTAWRSISST